MRPAVEHDDVTERGAIVAGNELRYLHAEGDGPPIVLLHGGIVDAAHLSWGSVIGALAGGDGSRVGENGGRDDGDASAGLGREVYAPDLLAYGRSSVPPGPYTTQRHVDAIEAFLDVVGLEPVDLVGTSLGGGVALSLALDEPERVRRLVAAGAFGLGTELPNGRRSALLAKLPVLNRAGIALARRSRGLAEASLESVVTDVRELPTTLVDAFVEELRRPNAGAAYRSWRKQEAGWGGWNTYVYTRLDELSVPALFVHGAEDDVFPARWSERAADLAPQGRVEVLENCDHWVPRDAPDRFESLTLEFLQ